MTDKPITLELIYSLPRPYESLEEHQRFTHSDLQRRSRPELSRERARLELRLLLDDEVDVWLLERLEKLREVLDCAR